MTHFQICCNTHWKRRAKYV